MTDLFHKCVSAPAGEGAARSVLVIDDEVSIREAIIDILELVDIDVVSAANGREGVELFTRCRRSIGVVLLDMQMPIMSGEETYRRIRALDAEIPIILSTGYGEIETIGLWESGLLASGNVYFLRKPYAIDALLALVQAQM